MAKARVLFAGTPAFALASLRALVDAGVTPVGVYTQPDRPAGRGKQLTASSVKQFAASLNIPVHEPASLRDKRAIEEFRELEPDLLIVTAYGLILPQQVLDIPTHGCLNVHASLLPRWRGAAPIQAAILAGDDTTGISLMSMTEGLDSGPVYASKALRIGANESAGQLHDRLAALGGEMLVRHLDDIVAGDLTAAEQDESQASYANKIQTISAALDWWQPAADLARKVRAYNPVPGAWFIANEERIKCWQARVVDAGSAQAGTVLANDRNGVLVACGEHALCMQQLQRPGKRAVSAAEFAAQFDIEGHILGSPM